MKGLQTRSVDSKYSSVIGIIVCGLKVIGLAPFTIEQTIKSAPNNYRTNCYCSTSVFLVSKIGLAYNVLLSILVLVVSAVATPELFSMRYPNKSSITQVIDVVQAILRTTTSSAVILSWAFRQGRATSIMNRLFEVDRLLSRMKKDLIGKKTSFTLFAGAMAFDIFLWLTFWAVQGPYYASFSQWFIFNVSSFIIHWFVMEYAIVLGVAAREIESFNKSLMMFKQLPNCLFFTPLTAHHNIPAVTWSPTHRGQLATLELLHSVRTTLSEVSQDIADFFSLPILPAIACSSLTIVYNLYYLLIPLFTSIKAPSIVIIINIITWIYISVFPLILLSLNVTRTSKQVKQTALTVHKLLAPARRQEIQRELERFSLQLIHEDLSFTAYGFFTLDFTLLQAVYRRVLMKHTCLTELDRIRVLRRAG